MVIGSSSPLLNELAPATAGMLLCIGVAACGSSEGGQAPSAIAGSAQSGAANQGGTTVTGGSSMSGGTPPAGTGGQGGTTSGAGGMGTAGATNGGGATGLCPEGDLGCPCLVGDTCHENQICVADKCESTLPGPDENCVLRSFQDHQYFFCDKRADKASAIQACDSVTMKVVRIDDAAEDAFIAGVIADGCCPTSMSVGSLWPGLYIGASDAAMPNQWVWEDDGSVFWQGTFEGMAVGDTYVNWFEGQPNAPFPEEMCARTDGLGWYDVACVPGDFGYGDFLGLGYICEEG